MPFINYDENGNITGQFNCLQYENQLYTDLEISDKLKVINGVVTDISETAEYKAKIKDELIKPIVIEYKEYFNELDRICGAKFARGLCTTEQINAQRISLQNERNQKIQGVNNG